MKQRILHADDANTTDGLQPQPGWCLSDKAGQDVASHFRSSCPRPSRASTACFSLFALVNAILFGTVTASVRGLTATESAATLTMYQLVILSAAYALTLPFGFVVPTWGDALMMTLNGVTNGLAQYWWTRALHMAPTGAVVPFGYLSLVWAILFGFAIWGDVPTVGLLVGSAIVVGSGLFLLWRESRRAVVPDDVG